MPTLLRVTNIHKAYNGRVLFDEASVDLTDQYKIGVVGRNGAGKSTLCRMILGLEELDSGAIWQHDDLVLSHLQQHDDFLEGETVIAYLERKSGRPDWRCAEVAARFAIGNDRLDMQVMSLSGGYRTRVKLTSMLLEEPNFLILDEPTNFLDLRTQLLLESFLKDFKGGALIVSHDRRFLMNTCTATLSVERQKLVFHPSSIQKYLLAREEQLEHAKRANAAVAIKRKQLQTFVDKNRASAGTAAQARNKQKQLDRLQDEDTSVEDARVVRLRFPEIEVRRGTAVRCTNMTIGYPDCDIATDINLEIDHGERVVIIGDNGQGKTTFVRSITDSLPAKSGSMRWGHGCELSVYAQHVYGSIPEDETVQTYLLRVAMPGTSTQQVQDTAGSFLFQGDDILKPVKILSGGERARLCLAGILLGKPNVLVLDEPTNHLDVESIGALGDALCEFAGTVILVCHDRDFVAKVATSIIEVRDGSVTSYPGSWDDWFYRVQQEIDQGLRGDTANESIGAPSAEEEKAHKKKVARELYDLNKKSASLERQIAKYEKGKVQLDEQLAAATPTDDITKQTKQTKQRQAHVTKLEKLEEEWMAVLASIEALS